MKRDERLFVEDILKSIKNIEKFSEGLTKEKFSKDELRQSAIIRQLEIIGEAVKNVSDKTKGKNKKIPWKDVAGFRDILSHAYFGLDVDRIWNVIKNDLSKLKKEIEKINVADY